MKIIITEQQFFNIKTKLINDKSKYLDYKMIEGDDLYKHYELSKEYNMLLCESDVGDSQREFYKKKYGENKEIIKDFLINQNKCKYEIYMYLISIGFYKRGETNINLDYLMKPDFSPKFSDYVGTIIVSDFLPELRKYAHRIENVQSDDDIENIIKTISKKIENILSIYELELRGPFLYSQGDLLIQLVVSKEKEDLTRHPFVIINNPEKIITTNEFMGIEDRKERKKYVKHIVNGYEYKFLINPISQDKYFNTGDSGFLGNLLGGALVNTLKIKDDVLSSNNSIIQINYKLGKNEFIVGGDGFYNLRELKKFEEDESYHIKKVDENNRYYKTLLDLNGLLKKIGKVKMIVFLSLGGDLSRTNKGGLLDKRVKITYYPYIIR